MGTGINEKSLGVLANLAFCEDGRAAAVRFGVLEQVSACLLEHPQDLHVFEVEVAHDEHGPLLGLDLDPVVLPLRLDDLPLAQRHHAPGVVPETEYVDLRVHPWPTWILCVDILGKPFILVSRPQTSEAMCCKAGG